MDGVLPIVLVRLCSFCAFFSTSNSCWSRNSSYSDKDVFCLLTSSALEDLTGEGEGRESSSTEPVLGRSSSLAEGYVSRSADEDLGL